MAQAATSTHDVPRFPPQRENPFDPAEVYRAARHRPGLSPMHLAWQGNDVSLISRYDDVKAMLNSDGASVDVTLPDFPVMAPHRQYKGEGPVTFLHTDPPRHTELRRLVMPDLSLKKVRAMRPTIQSIVDGALDAFVNAGSPGELQLDYAFKIPGAVICTLYGVPLDGAPELEEWARGMLYPNENGETDPVSSAAFAGYLAEHFEQNPSASPIVERLHEARGRGDVDLLDMLSVALTVFAGGFETTASMIGSAVFEILRRPGAADYVREADATQLAVAVDELLRYITVAHYGIGRVAKEDIPLPSGTVVPKGEHLMVSLASANRDEQHFPDADELQLGRTDNVHVAFGFGPHQCPGQHLARAEIQLAVQSLLRRLPTLRLVERPEDIAFRETAEIRGPIELHVEW